MQHASAPKIKSFDIVADFLENILHGTFSNATVIICCDQDIFLQQLCASLQLEDDPSEADEAGEPEAGDHATEDEDEEPCHGLLANTIDFLEKSGRVDLSFCPSLDHLRAYLGASESWTRASIQSEPTTGRPLLALVSPIHLHYHSLEFSAQGISRSLALAVNVAARNEMDLLICECQDLWFFDEEDVTSLGNLWDIHVPIVNSSSRAGKSEEIASQTVPIRAIAKRWFYFEPEEEVEMGNSDDMIEE